MHHSWVAFVINVLPRRVEVLHLVWSMICCIVLYVELLVDFIVKSFGVSSIGAVEVEYGFMYARGFA